MKKQMTTAAVILAMFAAPVMANGMDNQAFENQVFHTQADVPVQLAELSTQEMKETEGAAIWFAPAVGAGLRYVLTGFTRHGLNQAVSRGGVGVSNKAILNTLRNPQPGSVSTIAGRNAGTTKYIGKDASVVLNKNGRVVSTWARNSGGHRIK